MLNKEVNKSIVRKWIEKSSNNVHEGIRASDWLKTNVFSCNTRAKL